MRSIQIYDTTLRDGTQGEGVSLSLQDKLQITQRLDEIGIDFIEGGYPASNTKDSEYFARAREMKLSNAKICAFGMTRRRGMKAADDIGIQALVVAETPVVTIVGLQLGSVIAFAIVTETVFQWPGLGALFVNAVQYVDIPVMAAYLMFVAFVFATMNFLTDFVYVLIDPRLKA